MANTGGDAEDSLPDNDLIARLDDGARRIDSFAALDAGTHARTYAPGKWSGRAVLAHVSDVDLNYYVRFLKAISEPGSTIVPFDHDLWMNELGADRPLGVSVATIRAVSAGLAHVLGTRPAASLRRTSNHPERGAMSANDMVVFVVKHREHHLGQLDAIREGRSWTIAERVPY